MMDLPEYGFSKEEAQIIKGVWADPTGRLALTIIVDRIGSIQGRSFALGDPHMTSFNEGRRWVAQQLARVINTPLNKMFKEEAEHERTNPVLTATERAERVAADRYGGKR